MTVGRNCSASLCRGVSIRRRKKHGDRAPWLQSNFDFALTRLLRLSLRERIEVRAILNFPDSSVSRFVAVQVTTSSGGIAMNTLSISRRKFAHLLGVGAA